MHRLARMLSAVAVIAAALLFTAGPSATPPPSDYHWAQPGAYSAATPDAQPPAWVPIATLYVAPGCDYAWAQPGTAPVDAPYAQPPACVPAA